MSHTCFICLEEDPSVRPSPCVCKSLTVHTACQQKMIASALDKPHLCTVCGHMYKNVRVRVTQSPTMHGYASACVVTAAGGTTVLMLTHVGLAIWQQSQSQLLLSVFWFGAAALMCGLLGHVCAAPLCAHRIQTEVLDIV